MKIKLTVLASVMLILSLLLGTSIGAADVPQASGSNQALLNICDYGAIPNDGKDDSKAFSITVSSTSEPVYIPAGTYNISESIIVNSTSLFGAGVDKTVIIADIDDDREPIIWAGDNAQIRDLTIKFADNCMTGTEIGGERVGIVASSGTRRLCREAAISNVKIQNVGTGIYAPTIEAMQAYNENSDGALAFSVTFENISVIDFSYRGISMVSKDRTGNVWRNIYLSSGKYEANTAIFFDGSESECAFTELNIENSKLKNAARFCGAYATQISNLNIVNTELTQDNTAFLYCDQSNITINGFTLENSAPVGDKQSFIRLGDGAYNDLYYVPAIGYLHIYNMSILNPDLDVKPDSAQYMIARRNASLCNYTVEIDNLRVVAPEDIKAQYEAFNYDQREIELTLCGEKK